uniref:hypothetical protein n=1 Tax=Sphingomonas sp. TaxID=28214 RepID=UPI0026011B24|nr:hypothetical protein [Sphingomonas sp.]
MKMALWLTVLAVLGVASGAEAQNEATPLIPNLGGFSLPGTPKPSDQPVVLPTPIPSPTETATSTPRTPRIPAPRITPAPRPTPTARSVPKPEPRPTAVALPVTDVPSPVAAVPPRVTTGSPPVGDASPTPVATSVAAPATIAPVAEQTSATSAGPWVWLGFGGIVLAGILFALFRFRMRSRDDVAEQAQMIEIASADPVPTPTAEPVSRPEPAAMPATPASRAQIEIAMRPIRAGTNLTSGAVDYEITLRNIGDVLATDIRVDIRLMNASVDQDAMLGALFAQDIVKPLVARFDLAIGQTISLGGMAMIPHDGIVPLAINGRNFFVPVFSVNIFYRWGDSGHGQTAAAWVIGIERDTGAKMAPFRLDAGPRMYDAVGQRAQGLAITR